MLALLAARISVRSVSIWMRTQMAVTGTPSSGNNTLTGDGADDEIIGQEGSDIIDGGGGADVIYGDVKYGTNLQLDSDQADGGWSPGSVVGWFNPGSGGTIERWGNGFLGLSPADGSGFIELDGNTAGLDHVQTDIQLETGTTYILSFDHAARAGGSVNDDFEVTHNGVVIATISPSTTTSFTTTEITITGLAGTDTIGFREIASQDNGLGPLLDNIQISLTEAEVASGVFLYDDIIDGGAGDDIIYGQEGDDIITGGTGNDYMEGGIGDDVIVLTNSGGSDVVGDFTIGEDLLDVSGLLDDMGNPVDVDDAVVSSDGEGGSILTFPNGEQIRLRNIDPLDLDTDAELRSIGIPCFAGGTLLQATSGVTLVEDLVIGDALVTYSQRSDASDETTSKILQIFKRKITGKLLRRHPELLPVKIMAGALGSGLPKRDLCVSRQHRMLVQSKIAARMFGTSEVLISAIRLTALPGVFIDERTLSVEYFHLLFDNHKILIAEGAASESLFTGPEALKAVSPEAREEILMIFPELADDDYAPEPAALIPSNKAQKQLIARHVKNNRMVVERPR